MSVWAMAHPYLTTALVGLAIIAVAESVDSIAEAVGRGKSKPEAAGDERIDSYL